MGISGLGLGVGIAEAADERLDGDNMESTLYVVFLLGDGSFSSLLGSPSTLRGLHEHKN